MFPLLVGHRGWPEFYPENSLIGFNKAIAAGIPAIELDIQISADAIPFVIHDKDLQGTSQQQGDIALLTSKQLKKVSVHEPLRFQSHFYPEYLSPLSLVIELFEKHSQVQLFIEVKKEIFKRFDYERSFTILEPLISRAQQQITIISYDEQFLQYVQTKSEVKIGWVLTDYNHRSYKSAQLFKPHWLICNCEKVPSDNSPLWQGDWQWMLYDIVDTQLAKQYVARGVDAIETWDFKRLTTGYKV